MKEFTDSMWSYLKEKTSTPLLTNLVVSLLLWNWRILVILFFTDPSKHYDLTKIQQIESVLDLCNSFIYPLISAGLFTWLFPHLNNKVFKFLESMEIKRINIRVELSKGRKYTSKEYMDLDTLYQNADEELQKVRKAMNDNNIQKDTAISEMNNLRGELNRKVEIEDSYKYEQQFLIDSLSNFSEWKIQFDPANTIMCFRNQKPYYYTFRRIKIKENYHNIFTMVGQNFFNHNIREKTYLVLEIMENVNGQKYTTTVIGAQGPEFLGIK